MSTTLPNQMAKMVTAKVAAGEYADIGETGEGETREAFGSVMNKKRAKRDE